MKTKLQLTTNQLQPGMVLAEDLYTPKGLLLIPADTLIDEKHLFRIRLYQLPSIVIYEDTAQPFLEKAPPEDNRPINISYRKTKNFQEFKTEYLLQQALTQEKLNDVLLGEDIDENELYDISTTLIKSLRTKSDLFNYLYHLRNEDDYTFTHSLNTAMLANIFGGWLGLSDKEIKDLTISGFLHDIGKLNISPDILNKPGKLTVDEFESIKKHTNFGYDIIRDYDINDDIKNGVLLHHEKIDGSGYPLGLKDEQIPLFAKIIGIVDIYDAMTSQRSYHDKYSPFKVIQMFEQESYGLLDTNLLFVFLENIAHHYLGKDVLLSTGERARIVFIHNQSPSRPIIQINDQMVDLMFEPHITIDEIL
ncbi:HD-GYP domain-containing protein [Vallitaleaceae bacterium 9-2]